MPRIDRFKDVPPELMFHIADICEKDEEKRTAEEIVELDNFYKKYPDPNPIDGEAIRYGFELMEFMQKNPDHKFGNQEETDAAMALMFPDNPLYQKRKLTWFESMKKRLGWSK